MPPALDQVARGSWTSFPARACGGPAPAVRRQAQQKRAAREALQGSLAVFEELGARLWAEKARAELRRISGRAPELVEAISERSEGERR